MHSVSHPLRLSSLAGMKRLRRGAALLACLGVLAWTLFSATHWHDPADAGTRHHGGQECVLCLGSPVGAAPPQHSIALLLAPPLSAAVLPPAPRAPISAPRSAYQSRAPPAA